MPPSQPIGEGYTAEFERWWALYPRREGKGAAFPSFRRAKKLVTLDVLEAAARSYAERVKGDDLRYIKRPATWLNQHCWNDEQAGPPKRKYPPGYVPMGPGGA